MRTRVWFLSIVAAAVSLGSLGETVRLKATADIWLSDANDSERNSSAGKHPRFKLKSIQEMAAVRFDASPAKGREVRKATLFLHPAGQNELRYIRVSTVNQDWEEGNTGGQYGPASGATYHFADADSKRPWAWPGSCFADVIMSSGFSIDHWADRKEEQGGWISLELTPELVYAMVAGDTDGLAIMDGGTIGLFNNFVQSRESGQSAPYIDVELGGRLDAAPAKPAVKAVPAVERAHIGSGALKVTIAEARDVFCWRLKLNGKPVERWRVKHPAPEGPTEFYLEEVEPSAQCALEVVAVSPGGVASEPVVVNVSASPVLSQDVLLGEFRKPSGGSSPPMSGAMRVWALPGVAKISPEKPEAMFGDVGGDGDYRSANAVWDGRKVGISGAKGEYASFQVCVEALQGSLSGIKVRLPELKGPAGLIQEGEIELFKNWYARNRDNQWQPAYCVPVKHGEELQIPDPARGLPNQQNQTVYVDVYIPKDAQPGKYAGALAVEANGTAPVTIPVELTVFDFTLPDRLTFWPELNAYHIPSNAHDHWRLAHQHRCVLNCWVWRPQLQGSGKDIRVVWDRYDREVGPLLSGEAFKDNRRAGRPVECMYLPFEDSWPTPLSKQNYNYQGHWPGRGENNRHIVEHYLKAPYIGDALSQDYKDAFLSVQRQFSEHFKEKGWTQTEMHCFYGGKNTHRTQYGSNMWWTTDEPYHWDDWLALQFFLRLWAKGLGGADPKLWAGRADISRPQWHGRVLDHIVGPVYFGTGAFMQYRRCRWLEQETGLDLRAYGSANADNKSNTSSVVALMNVWLNGGNAFLPWQTLSRGENAFDVNDRATAGNALLVPGGKFGLPVVGDMRLKALRDGQQICEYFRILADRYGLEREQVKAMVFRAVSFSVGTRAGAGADNADALEVSALKSWQISELKRTLAELIVKAPRSAGTRGMSRPADAVPVASVPTDDAEGRARRRKQIIDAIVEGKERVKGVGISVKIYGVRTRARALGVAGEGIEVNAGGLVKTLRFDELDPVVLLRLAEAALKGNREGGALLRAFAEDVGAE